MTNWTPRAANTIASLSQPRILSITSSNQVLTLVCEVMPQRTYQLQYKPALAEPTWSPAPLAIAQPANGRFLVVHDVLDITASNRFYRLLLLP